MNFVLLFGPQAVGKMTVGNELAKLTEMKLLHNHMTIELLKPFFGFSQEMWRLSNLFREEIFKSFADSDNYGLIFTYVWAFNLKEDWDDVNQICEIFSSQGANVYLVELEADVDERLIRNKTAYRLEQKPTKRDLEHSESELLSSMEKLRLNSKDGEITSGNYLRINNTNLSAKEAAALIKENFNL